MLKATMPIAGNHRGLTEPAVTCVHRPLLADLEALIPCLNPVMRRVAEYVLLDPERVLCSSILEMQRGSGASAGSIVGFCRTLGIKGFLDFKIALARGMIQHQSRVAVGNGQVAEVCQSYSQWLEETFRLNSEQTVKKASGMILRARKLEFFSIGMSFPVALSGCSQLRMFGLTGSAHADCQLQLFAATQLQKGDLAFGISCSGSTQETIRCLQVARENNATTIALTNFVKSPITAHSDLVLYARPAEIQYRQSQLASRITQFALMDAVLVHIAKRRNKRVATCLEKAAEYLRPDMSAYCHNWEHRRTKL